jgi:hypothetical protein
LPGFFHLGELPGFLRAHGHALQTPAPSLEGGEGQSQWGATMAGLEVWNLLWLPSGKHTKNYGKSPFFMGKSTINGHFQ